MKKKLFLLPIVAVFGMLQLSAQNTKPSIGIRAGVNFTNINGRDLQDKKLENDLKTGFHVGVTADVPLASEFYFQPGLLFSTKGAGGYYSNNGIDVNLSYLELPLNFLYKPTLGTGKLLLGFGPYLGYGIGGKVDNGSTEADIKFKSDAGNEPNTVYFKPLDAGANFLAGYEFANRFSLQLNAQLGLVNLNAYDNDGKLKNTGFGISAGYRF